MAPPRLGIALRSATVRNDAEAVLADLDAWAADAGVYPSFMPIWSRLHVAFADAPDGAWFPSGALLDGLAARSVDPMIYMTSGNQTYEDILAGTYDGHLELWGIAAAKHGRDLIVRWDQEPNGDWPARWAGSPPHLYRAAFARVEDRIRHLGGATNVRMFYCPVLKRREDLPEFERYYPGDAALVVGFDSYTRQADPGPLENRWDRARDALLQLSDAPIVVGEFGMRRGLDGRDTWLDGLERLDGIDTAVYFDMDLAIEGHSWSLDPDERRRIARLTA